ncbi:MAG TPA: FGGY family carbohydrate kinase [Caulobacteraceae bacterium]
MPELLLAIDVGTTTVRAVVFSPDGAPVAMAATPTVSRMPRPGWLEQDAGRVWRSVRRVIAKALAGAGRLPADIAAVGVTSQRTSAVVWDRATGAPLSPLVVWSDLRGLERSAELRAAGFFVAPQQAAAKLEQVLASVEGAKQLGRQRRLAWGNIDSYVIWKLSGGAAHITDASQAWPTGYLDPSTMTWNQALIAHQSLDESTFPRLVDTWGPLAAASARVFGAKVPICADVADQQSALIAHGDEPGGAKFTYGTSATLDLSTGAEFLYKSPASPPFIVSSVARATRFCLESMIISGGSALDWLRRACALGGHGRFEALAASVPDAAGAAFLPALQGLGSPYGDASRRGLLAGLNPSVSPAHIARAGMEGLAFRAREALEHLYGLTGFALPEALGVDGGVASNDTFLQVQADMLGRPVRRHATLEATACGAALCAGRGAGVLSPGNVGHFVRYDKTFEPRIGADEAQARFNQWRSLVYPQEHAPP